MQTETRADILPDFRKEEKRNTGLLKPHVKLSDVQIFS
jgi:hypothetical protein